MFPIVVVVAVVFNFGHVSKSFFCVRQIFRLRLQNFRKYRYTTNALATMYMIRSCYSQSSFWICQPQREQKKEWEIENACVRARERVYVASASAAVHIFSQTQSHAEHKKSFFCGKWKFENDLVVILVEHQWGISIVMSMIAIRDAGRIRIIVNNFAPAQQFQTVSGFRGFCILPKIVWQSDFLARSLSLNSV